MKFGNATPVHIVEAPQVPGTKTFFVPLQKVTLVDANTLLLRSSCFEADLLAFEVANIVSELLDVTPGRS